MEPIVEQAIMRHHELAREKLTEAVAVNDRSLPIHYEEESPFANLLAQAVLQHTDADFAIVNSGLLGPAGGRDQHRYVAWPVPVTD